MNSLSRKKITDKTELCGGNDRRYSNVGKREYMKVENKKKNLEWEGKKL